MTQTLKETKQPLNDKLTTSETIYPGGGSHSFGQEQTNIIGMDLPFSAPRASASTIIQEHTECSRLQHKIPHSTVSDKRTYLPLKDVLEQAHDHEILFMSYTAVPRSH